MVWAIQKRKFRKPSEEGYILLTAIFLLALLTISLSIAVPRITQQIHRERELEAMRRGKQYTRAIQLYARKFHRYPPNIDALIDTDGIRFLRKQYVDPITGKSDWQPILFGENKLPTAVGFFGLTKAGLPIAPIGSDSDESAGAATGVPGQSGRSSPNPNMGTNNAQSDSSPAAAQAFGGTLIGVTIPSEKRSMLVYKRQQQYNMWEFVYSPSVDGVAMMLGPAGANALATGSASSPGALANSPWGPNGNLPSPPSDQPPTATGPSSWGPNGNLPSPPPPQSN